jgi:hypothetical protein
VRPEGLGKFNIVTNELVKLQAKKQRGLMGYEAVKLGRKKKKVLP